MKLYITLKQSDADGLGGELMETLGMERARRDPKTFTKELAVTELLERFTQSFDSEDEDGEDGGDDVNASAGAFAGRRRRRRRRVRPTDFLLYEDNSLYALPYLEPLTDRGIVPLRVSLKTDSTVALTPINASVVSADQSATPEDKRRHSDALRALDDAIHRAKNGFKSITADQKDDLMHEIAEQLKKTPKLDPKWVDDLLQSKSVKAMSDDDAELATAALDLAHRALLAGSASPEVLAALRAAAKTLNT